MLLNDYFFENSLLLPYFEYRLYMPDEDAWNDFFNELIGIVFKEFAARFETFVQLLDNLKNNKFIEAKKCLGIKDNFIFLSNDISDMRYNIKFLLSGLIITSSTIHYSKIMDYCVPRTYKEIKESGLVYYNNLIQHAREISTTEELKAFNRYFKNLIIEMVIIMIENYIRRLTFMIQYFKNENQFLIECEEAANVMDNFKTKFEKLKVTT